MKKRHKLRNSLVIRLIAVCVIIAASFLFVVSLIVRTQNVKVSNEFIVKSYRVIIDDILSRREKLLKNTQLFAEQKSVGTTVNFVTDYKTKFVSNLYFTQDSYRRLAESAYNMGQVSGVWKMMIYDVSGDLVSFFRNDPQDRYFGYALGFPEPTFMVSQIGPDGGRSETPWVKRGITGIASHLNRLLPTEPIQTFEVMDGTLCIVAYAPIFISAYDPHTENTIRDQAGVAVAVQACDKIFEDRLSALTGTTVTVITEKEMTDNFSPVLSASPDKMHNRQKNAKDIDIEAITFHETVLDGDRFFQGILPLSIGDDGKALISVMYSKAFARENTRQMILYMLLVSIGCIILIIPITVFFSNRIMAPVEALAETARAIQGGEFDTRAKVFKNDEIGELATAFNHMTDKLRSSLKALYQERESLRKYERIVSTSQDLMALINRNYIYEAVNESLLKTYGKCREEVVGRTIPEIIGKSVFKEKIQIRIDEAFCGQTVHYQELFDFDAGLQKLMDVTYFPFFDERGNVESVVSNARDITETRNLEKQLMQSQRIESIGTLAGGVAHEINNPINGIMNYAQLILDRIQGKDVPEREYAQEILRETDRIAGIVRNLLTFARNENQSHSPALISDIVASVLSLIQTVMRHDQITLEVSIPEDLPKIKCRSQQIQQVLMNLLTNARDALNERYPGHSPEKKLQVVATVLWKQDRKYIRTTIEDAGTGIPTDIRGKIFDPFFTTKPKENGTGLGLSISYGIMRDHGGELSVESQPGRYTRFHMDLPVDNGWLLSEKERESK